MTPRTVKVKIENVYSDGHESESEVVVAAPDGDLDEWWNEVVHEHTGDGHGIDPDIGSCLTATIIEADDPALVGQSTEWTD